MTTAAGFGWRPVAARIYVGSERREIISDFSLPHAEILFLHRILSASL
jgi:hypothetical protein